MTTSKPATSWVPTLVVSPPAPAIQQNRKHPRFLVLATLWAVATAMLGLIYGHAPGATVTETLIQTPNATNPGRVELPVHGQAVGEFIVQGKLELNSRSARHLWIKADDCVSQLAIDDQPVFQGACNVCQDCDGHDFSIPARFSAGTHHIRLTVRNLGGEFALEIGRAIGLGWGNLLLLLLTGWSAMWLLSRSPRSLRAHLPLGCFLLSLMLATTYFAITPPSERQYDVDGHVAYLQSLQETGRIPPLR